MLSGDGGQGKSLLALQLAVGRALGREWIGLLPAPGRTLVLSAEDDGDEMHRRLDDIRKFYSASWVELSDIGLVDLVGENSVLGELVKGRIKPTKMYEALDAYMADFNPSLTVLDVLADMFAGDENDRGQVRQFVTLLKHLARKHHCAILLLSHPSLTGMNTGTGLSGSTDWHNAVRSRAYLQTPKTDEGATRNTNLRTFQGMKSNYGERGGKFDLVWRDGVFIRLNGPAGFDKMAAEQKADEVFLASLKWRNAQSRTVSDKPGVNYAPAVFAKEPETIAAAITAKRLEAAMERLFQAGKIRVEIKGPPSRQTRSIVIVADL
jgi:RecA-family ATPase